MLRSSKSLLRLFRPRRARDLQVDPADDQTDSPDAHMTPSAPLESREGTDAEGPSRLCRDFLDLAMRLQPYFPQACSWLEPQDLQDIEEPPIDGGRFADVRSGRLEGREVAIKSFRCYICGSCDRIRMVSWDEHRYDLHGHN